MTDATFLRRVLILVGVGAVVALAWQLRQVVLLLFGATLLSVGLTGAAGALARRTGLGPKASLAIVVVGLVVGLGLILGFFGWRLQAQISQAAGLLPAAFSSLMGRIEATPIGHRLVGELNGARLGPLVMHVPSYALATVKGIAEALVVVVGGVYLAAQPRMYRQGLLRLMPEKTRERFAPLLGEFADQLRRWLLTQLIAMVVVGVAIGIGLTILGVPASAALGLFAGLMEFVPIVGQFVGGIPAVLLALFSSPDKGLSALALFVVVQQLESNLLIPFLQQRMMRVPPMISLFAMAIFGLVFGGLGVILAMPLTIVCSVAVRRLYLDRRSLPAASARVK
ncbi:MAG: AI-2E family transporter [Caulobacteraceae bacterium]